MPFIVAIRWNHGVLMPSWQRVRYNRWRAFEQPLAHRTPETRFIREIVFGQRRSRRYFQITKGTEQSAESWFIMTDLPGDILRLPLLYSLRNPIEYGFKQIKNELGWADLRLTESQISEVVLKVNNISVSIPERDLGWLRPAAQPQGLPAADLRQLRSPISDEIRARHLKSSGGSAFHFLPQTRRRALLGELAT